MSEPSDNRQIPNPPHPVERREPLPTERPKPLQDDPAAHQRTLEILASPSYRQADQDVEFLNQNDTRGIRLQLDYQKAEMLLEQHGVKETIVVFGGTRIRNQPPPSGGWKLYALSKRRIRKIANSPAGFK